MAQSKLEVYLQILQIVAQNSSIKENRVAAKSKIAHEQTKQSLTFLTEQGLIEYESNAYGITRRGYAVLKHFRILNEQPKTVEELNC